MEKTLVELSAEEFEEIVERTIDKRLQVWLSQLMDALLDLPEEDDTNLQPAFIASLQHSIEQARSGEGIDLKAFREQLGR